jgi:hypothetical protein
MHADQLTNLAEKAHLNRETFQRANVQTFQRLILPFVSLQPSIFNFQFSTFKPSTATGGSSFMHADQLTNHAQKAHPNRETFQRANSLP